jgi:hypothetical protein
MLYDEPPKETARERAMRKWRNHHILKQVVADGVEPATMKWHNSSKLKKEILAIFRTKNTDILMNYMIAIKLRRRKLLKEKLRRLRESENG